MKNRMTIVLALLVSAVYAEDTAKPLTYRHFNTTETAERVISMTPVPVKSTPRWARDVSQKEFDWKKQVNKEPFFSGPIPFVIPPTDKDEPFYPHNHQPSITWLKNGDLLAIWYSTNSEYGPILTVVASRLRPGKKTWDPSNAFFKAHNHNMHGSSIFHDGQGTIYHFNGMAPNAATGWRKLALLMRISKDSGVTWTPPRAIDDAFTRRHQVISGMIMTEAGVLIQNCDAVPGANGGSALYISRDGAKTWTDPGKDKPTPEFTEGGKGEGTIAGIHAKVVELSDGRLLAFGRMATINKQMPMSVSSDLGKTWTYKASPFPPISGGQRLVLRRLQEGTLLFASFTSPRGKPEANGMTFKDQKGREFTGYGLFAAVSFDEGRTWPVRKLLTPGKGDFDGGAWTKKFTATPTRAEHGGYLAATQTPNGVIHLISSRLHYRFNLTWLLEGTSRGENRNR
ncbi:MAG: sialidase family protein [Kiritimatiellia bacterium]|jgi:hypothetical protein|nr:sialidase family protein [Kiritimatiellia bacterium]